MSGLQKLLCFVLVIGVICVVLQSGDDSKRHLEVPVGHNKDKTPTDNSLVLTIRNKYPSRCTFSLFVNGRKLISCHNPTSKSQMFTLPLRHHTPLISVAIYKHTSTYGPLYIDKLEAHGISLLPQLIFTGRQTNSDEPTNLFENDPVRWSEMCASGILVHQGKYIFRPQHKVCPFIEAPP